MKRSILNKKIKLGRYGFSLVEVLAAIVILGILTTIAIVSVSRLIERAKKNHYETQEKNMILGAQSFFENTKDALPKSLGQSRNVTLRDLINSKYMDKVLDYNKNECDPDNSYVKVTKYTDTKYSYVAYLSCPIANYNTQKKGNPNFEGPTIEIDYTGAYRNSAVELKISDSDGIISYSYIVDKKLNDGKKVEINNSGEKVGNTKKNINETISLVGNIPGNFEFTVKATDIYGNVSTYKKQKEIADKDGPICGETISVRIKNENVVVDVSKSNQSTWESTLGWVNKTRVVTVTCTDTASGCSKNTYEQEFDKDTNTSYIKIVDNVGNTTKCKVPVFIDKTAPVIDITDNPEKSSSDDYLVQWVNHSYAVTLKGHDPNFDTNPSKNKSSGFDYYAYTYPDSKRTSDDGTPENSVHIYEKTGNSSRIKANQTNAAKTNTFVFTTDNFSKERNMYVNFILCDKAGNCSKPDKDGSITRIKIDKTDPKIKTVTNPYSDWTNAPIDSSKPEYVINMESIDPEPFEVSSGAIKYPGENEKDSDGNTIELKDRITSGIVKYSYRYPRENNPRISGDGRSERLWHEYDVSTATMLTYKNSDLTVVTTSPFKKDREEYVEFQICDKAGNCSYVDDPGSSKKCDTTRNGNGNCECNAGVCQNSAKSMIKIDTMPPKCQNEGGTGQGVDDWVNQPITLFGKCSDPLSPDPDGVHSRCVVETVSTPVGDYSYISPGKVEDHAGNVTDCIKEIVQIDLVKPKIKTVTNPYSDWTNAPIDSSKQVYRIELAGEDYGYLGHASGLKYYAFTYPDSTRTAADGEAESGVWHIYDGPSGKYNLFSKTADLKVVTTSQFSAERDMKVVFEVCDRAGNCSDPEADDSNSMIKIDTTKPVIDSVVNANNPDGNTWKSATVLANASEEYTITLTSHDPITYTPNENISSGLKKHSYSYNPSSGWTDYSNSNVSPFETTKFTVERNQDVYFRVCDNAGNCSDNKTSNIKIDNTPPDCTTEGGSETWINKTSHDQSRTIVSTCVENGTNVSRCDPNFSGGELEYKDDNTNIYQNAGSLGEGSSVTVKDNAGNSTVCPAKETVRIDRSPPSCGTITKTNCTAGTDGWCKKGTTGDITVKTTCSDGTEAGRSGCSDTGDITMGKSSADGTHTISKDITDVAGNKTTCSAVLKIDRTPPSCGTITKNGCVAGSNNWCKAGTNKVNTTATCSDATSGCIDSQKGANAVVFDETSGNGVHNLSETVTDKAGNTYTCNATVSIDTTPPTVNINYGYSGTNAFKYTGSATDTGGSNLATTKSYRFVQDTTSTKVWSNDTASPAGSSYVTENQHYTSDQSYYLQVKDNAGNIGTAGPLDNHVLCANEYKVSKNYTAQIFKWLNKKNNDAIIKKDDGTEVTNYSVQYHCDNTGIISTDPNNDAYNLKGPYVEIYMAIRYCNCAFDSVVFPYNKTASLCSSSVGSPNDDHHSDRMAIIVYEEGSKTACRNLYSRPIQQVCRSDSVDWSYDDNGNPMQSKHGWLFFTDNSARKDGISYRDIVFNKWMHNGLNKYNYHSDAGDACESACLNKITSLS